MTEAVLAEYYDVFEYERLKYLDRRRIARLRGVLEGMGIKVKSAGLLKNGLSHHEGSAVTKLVGHANAFPVPAQRPRRRIFPRLSSGLR